MITHIPLEEIAVANNFTSTFFGIFTHVPLGEFTYEEASASILRSDPSPLTEADVAMVVQLVNHHYHPLKLNIAADLVWQERQKNADLPELGAMERAYRRTDRRSLRHSNHRGTQAQPQPRGGKPSGRGYATALRGVRKINAFGFW
ncbi:MAG: hypothetical protein R2932_16885 [Caldilineaceae bacterium]